LTGFAFGIVGMITLFFGEPPFATALFACGVFFLVASFVTGHSLTP
jgi:hypothetical protein